MGVNYVHKIKLSLLHFRRYRYTAYRHFVRFCLGWLGKKNRVVLQSCAVKEIRQTFPSANFTGFLPPL